MGLGRKIFLLSFGEGFTLEWLFYFPFRKFGQQKKRFTVVGHHREATVYRSARAVFLRDLVGVLLFVPMAHYEQKLTACNLGISILQLLSRHFPHQIQARPGEQEGCLARCSFQSRTLRLVKVA